AILRKSWRSPLHHLLHCIRRATFEDQVTAVHRLDMWRAHVQRRGRERRRTAIQLSRSQYRFTFHERDGFPIGWRRSDHRGKGHRLAIQGWIRRRSEHSRCHSSRWIKFERNAATIGAWTIAGCSTAVRRSVKIAAVQNQGVSRVTAVRTSERPEKRRFVPGAADRLLEDSAASVVAQRVDNTECCRAVNIPG